MDLKFSQQSAKGNFSKAPPLSLRGVALRLDPASLTAGKAAQTGGLSVSKKPRRVRARRCESNEIHFLRRHVRRRKYFSDRKCGICPLTADKFCARRPASSSKKVRSTFFDSLRPPKRAAFRRLLWLGRRKKGEPAAYGCAAGRRPSRAGRRVSRPVRRVAFRSISR